MDDLIYRTLLSCSQVRINAVEALIIGVKRQDYPFIKDKVNIRLLEALRELEADIGDKSEAKFGEIKYMEQLDTELKSLRLALESNV